MNELKRDPRAQRVDDLRELGYSRLAKEVGACSGASDTGWECKRLVCPSYAEMRSQRNRQTVRNAIRSMDGPQVALLTYPTRSLWSVVPDMKRFRKALSAIRRVLLGAGAASVVGTIEVKPTAKAQAWNLHAHLTLDVRADTALDEERVRQAWDDATESRGFFDVQDEVADRSAWAAYVTKVSGWFVTAGALTTVFRDRFTRREVLRLLDLQWRALKGLHLVFTWRPAGGNPGMTRSGRRDPRVRWVLRLRRSAGVARSGSETSVRSARSPKRRGKGRSGAGEGRLGTSGRVWRIRFSRVRSSGPRDRQGVIISK